MYIKHNISKIISKAPNSAAVYAMYERVNDKKAAYVGISSNLKSRLRQHMIRRDSSATTNVSAVRLDPDYIRKIKWWTSDKFEDKKVLEAAELIAFDIFNPVLRSKGSVSVSAKELYDNEDFNKEMINKFKEGYSGEIVFPNFNLVLDRLDKLEREVERLKTELEKYKR